MYILILNQSNIIKSNNLDSHLSDIGMNQLAITLKWLYEEIDIKNGVGFTSPYYGCVQAASMANFLFDINFNVENNLRNFISDSDYVGLSDGGVNIENRSNEFINIKWNKEWIDKEKIFFKSEVIKSVKSRVKKFYNNIVKENYNKVFLITHTPIINILSNYIVGNDEKLTEEDIFKTCSPCSLYLFENNKNLWHTKIVWN